MTSSHSAFYFLPTSLSLCNSPTTCLYSPLHLVSVVFYSKNDKCNDVNIASDSFNYFLNTAISTNDSLVAFAADSYGVLAERA